MIFQSLTSSVEIEVLGVTVFLRNKESLLDDFLESRSN